VDCHEQCLEPLNVTTRQVAGEWAKPAESQKWEETGPASRWTRYSEGFYRIILRRSTLIRPTIPVPRSRTLAGSGVAVTAISLASIWTPPTLAVPFAPPDRVTVKIESIDCTGEKVLIPENCGEVALAKAVRALEHKGEGIRGRGKVPPRHATSDAWIVPDPVTWVLSSENRSPTIELLEPTEALSAMANDFVSPDATENGKPNSEASVRVDDKPAVSDESIGVGKLMRVPMPVTLELQPKPERSWSPTVQPLGKA